MMFPAKTTKAPPKGGSSTGSVKYPAVVKSMSEMIASLDPAQLKCRLECLLKEVGVVRFLLAALDAGAREAGDADPAPAPAETTTTTTTPAPSVI